MRGGECEEDSGPKPGVPKALGTWADYMDHVLLLLRKYQGVQELCT